MAATNTDHLETQVSLTGVEQVQRGQKLIAAGFAGLRGEVGSVANSYKALNVASGELMVAGGMMVAAGGGILSWLNKCATEAGRTDGTQRRLRVAFTASGQGGAEAAKGIREYAEALQDKTGVEEDSIINAAAMLASFRMGPEKIKEYLPRLLDMQEGLKKVNGETMSLEQIAIMLGKGDVGMITSLRRVGVMVDENKYKTQGYKAIIEELDKEFGGQATEAVKGYSGQMKLLSVDIDEAGESAGKSLLPSLKLGAQGLRVVANSVRWLSDHTGGAVGIMGALVGGLLLVGGTIVVVRPAVLALRDSWEWVRNAALEAAAAQKLAASAGSAAAGSAAANNAATAASGAAGWIGKAGGWLKGAWPKLAKGGLIALGASAVGGIASDWGAGGLDNAKAGKKLSTSDRLRTGVGVIGGDAITGAGLGAAVGSVVPVIGTAIGAAIGGVIGAGVGLFSAKKATDEAIAEGKKKLQTPASATERGNAYLAEIVKLLDKQNRAIIGGGKLAMGSLSRGDIDRAIMGTLARQVI